MSAQLHLHMQKPDVLGEFKACNVQRLKVHRHGEIHQIMLQQSQQCNSKTHFSQRMGRERYRVVGYYVHFHPCFPEVYQQILHAFYPSVSIYLQLG